MTAKEQRNPFAVPARLHRLQIEVTTHCTLACAGCQRTVALGQRRWRNAHMAVDTFRTLLGHAPPADALVLQGIGEPSLHPDLAELIRLGRESGRCTDITLNTNALARPVAYFAELRAAGLGHVGVSVDSLDPATAAAARSGTDTAELTRRIAALLALFEGRVTCSVVVSRLNLGELPALIERLARLGARTIEIQPLTSYAAGTDRLRLSADELRRVAATVAELRPRLPGVAIMVAAAMTPDGSRCRRPLHSAYVTVDGLLTPCCLTDDAGLFGRTSLVTQDFAQAWQAEAVAAWFSRYFDRDPAECRGCGFNARGAADDRMPEVVEGGRLRRSGRPADAAALLLQGLRRSTLPEALAELGLAAAGSGNARAGDVLLNAAALLHPEPAATQALVEALAGQGNADLAVALALANLDRHPGFTEGWRATAALMRARGGTGEGIALADLGRRALRSGNAAGLEAACTALAGCAVGAEDVLVLAHLLRTSGRADLARLILDAAAARAPDDIGTLMAQCVAQLEIVYASEAEIDQRRARFLDLLAGLAARVEHADAAVLAKAAAQVGQAKPFYLSYQGHDDCAPMRQWGGIVTRLMAAAPAVTSPPPAAGERIRVGFVGAYFRMHSVSKLFGGWLRGLDRARFEVFGYEVRDQPGPHPVPPLAASCDAFRQGPRTLAEWRRTIAADRPHVLIYPEVGMEPSVVRLAATRLAAVQCVAWGHPVTTGLPTMDYFLSSALMEPADGDHHYSETLIRLPNLSIAYRPPELPAGRTLQRGAFGLAADDVVYICCQSLYKYLPRYDAVFARIAAALPAARFVFITGHDATTTGRFRRRLAESFPVGGMERHCRLVPQIPHEDFPAFLGLGDVALDSIGWSGGNTTLEAVAAGLPIVTTPTPLMRGRHSAAILERIGLGDAVAADLDSYVDLAVTLGGSAAARAEFRRRLGAGRPALYDDHEAVRGLERFLVDAVGLEPAPRSDDDAERSPANGASARLRANQ